MNQNYLADSITEVNLNIKKSARGGELTETCCHLTLSGNQFLLLVCKHNNNDNLKTVIPISVGDLGIVPKNVENRLGGKKNLKEN